MKKMFYIIFSIVIIDVNAQGNLDSYMKSPSSQAEVTKILADPVNQNNAELVMFILKCIEDKGITDINKKIAFVDTFKVSNDIKDQVKLEIKHNITYSDHTRIGYGLYELKGCNHSSSLDVGITRPDYIYNFGSCLYKQGYLCG